MTSILAIDAAGPALADLPAIGYSNNLTAAAVTLRGFLVDLP